VRVRDSAGIQIVESRAPAAPGSVLVDSVPAFDRGGASGGAEYEYIGPISAAVRLSDGRIVAAGWAQTELRVSDSTGRWLVTIGRQGSGPGEFEGLGWLYRGRADSLITFEPNNRRLQVFDSAGNFGRLSTPSRLGERGFPRTEGVFGDGSILLRSSLMDPAAGTDRTIRNRMTVLRYRPDADEADSIAGYLGSPNLRHPKNPQWQYGMALFAPTHSVAALGDRLAMSTGDRFSISLLDLSGHLWRIVRRPWTPVPVSAAEIAAAAAKWVEDVDPEIREAIRAGLIAISDATVKPAIGSIRFATDGRLWVEYGGQDEADARRFAVFDSSGRWQSDATIPASVTVLEIGSDYLLASTRDDDGFYHLRRYRVKLGG